MATPVRPLRENTRATPLRSPARACVSSARPVDGAGRSRDRCPSGRNHRWPGRQTAWQNSHMTAPIGNQTGSSDGRQSPQKPVFMRVAEILQRRPLTSCRRQESIGGLDSVHEIARGLWRWGQRIEAAARRRTLVDNRTGLAACMGHSPRVPTPCRPCAYPVKQSPSLRRTRHGSNQPLPQCPPRVG